MKKSARPRSYKLGPKTQVNIGDAGRLRRHPTNRREDAIIIDRRADAARLAVEILRSLVRRGR